MSDQTYSGSLSNIGQQADEIITEETDWVDLGSDLNIAIYKQDDSYPEWHSAIPFEPMFLAYLYATVEERKLSTLPSHLRENPELARAFGFDPEDLPSKSTFKPSRLKTRFDDLERTVDRACKDIRRVAAERGAPVGNTVRAEFENEEDDSEPSKRTINRMLRRNGRKVLQEVEQAVLPSISLPRPDDAIYNDDELLMLETIAAINNSAANEGGEQLSDVANPEPDPDDLFHEDGPTGETLLESIKKLSVDEIAELLNFSLKKTYLRAKPKLNNFDNFDTNVMVALDITYMAYWGKEEGIEWLQGAPEDKEYRKCFKFATAAIVGQHSHYTVAVLPLGSSEYADNQAYLGKKEQSYHIGDVTRGLLDIASEYVNIRTVVGDREFYATDAIAALEEHNLKYIIPAPVRKQLKRKVNSFGELKRGHSDEKRDVELYVEHDYSLHGKVKYQDSNASVSTNLVILPPEEESEVRNGPQPFVTNIESVSDEVALDRRRTKRQIERYNSRAAVENTYSSIKKCAAKTTSKAIEVRWFHFGFACIIYNLWLLVDFLTQDRIGILEIRTKPRIKLSRFLRWVDRETSVLI